MRNIHQGLPTCGQSGWRFYAGVCTTVLLGIAWTGCGLSFDECRQGDHRCVGSVLETCKHHQAGIDGSFNGPSVGYHHGSPNTWEPLADCGAADLCKTSTRVDSSGDIRPDALCVLDPTPAPACAGSATDGKETGACEGTTAVKCLEGFAVGRQLCASCDQGLCTGGLYTGCSDSNQCALGLVCESGSMSCEMPCTCPEGAACDACRPAEYYTGAGFQWVCHEGFCFEQYP